MGSTCGLTCGALGVISNVNFEPGPSAELNPEMLGAFIPSDSDDAAFSMRNIAVFPAAAGCFSKFGKSVWSEAQTTPVKRADRSAARKSMNLVYVCFVPYEGALSKPPTTLS